MGAKRKDRGDGPEQHDAEGAAQAPGPSSMTPALAEKPRAADRKGAGGSTEVAGSPAPCASGGNSSPAAAAGAAEAEPDEDLLCPLCHELYYEPVVTQGCGHTFCQLCFERLFQVRRGPHDAQVPPAARCRDCPMCRRPLNLGEAAPAADLRARIAAAHPAHLERRAGETAAERARLAQRQLHFKRLLVGNTHALRAETRGGGGGNVHDWTFYVRMEGGREDEERFIERVIVRLHPTFHPSTVVLSEPLFAVRRLGWGSFVITAVVIWKEEWQHEAVVVHWMLDFDGQGGEREIDLEFERRPAPQQPQQQREGSEAGAGQQEGGSAGPADALAVVPYQPAGQQQQGQQQQQQEQQGQGQAGQRQPLQQPDSPPGQWPAAGQPDWRAAVLAALAADDIIDDEDWQQGEGETVGAAHQPESEREGEEGQVQEESGEQGRSDEDDDAKASSSGGPAPALLVQLALLLSTLTCFLPALPAPAGAPLPVTINNTLANNGRWCSLGDEERGGDYDLSRFLCRGWHSPASSSGDERLGGGVYDDTSESERDDGPQ